MEGVLNLSFELDFFVTICFVEIIGFMFLVIGDEAGLVSLSKKCRISTTREQCMTV